MGKLRRISASKLSSDRDNFRKSLRQRLATRRIKADPTSMHNDRVNPPFDKYLRPDGQHGPSAWKEDVAEVNWRNQPRDESGKVLPETKMARMRRLRALRAKSRMSRNRLANEDNTHEKEILLDRIKRRLSSRRAKANRVDRIKSKLSSLRNNRQGGIQRFASRRDVRNHALLACKVASAMNPRATSREIEGKAASLFSKSATTLNYLLRQANSSRRRKANSVGGFKRPAWISEDMDSFWRQALDIADRKGILMNDEGEQNYAGVIAIYKNLTQKSKAASYRGRRLRYADDEEHIKEDVDSDDIEIIENDVDLDDDKEIIEGDVDLDDDFDIPEDGVTIVEPPPFAGEYRPEDDDMEIIDEDSDEVESFDSIGVSEDDIMDDSEVSEVDNALEIDEDDLSGYGLDDDEPETVELGDDEAEVLGSLFETEYKENQEEEEETKKTSRMRRGRGVQKLARVVRSRGQGKNRENNLLSGLIEDYPSGTNDLLRRF